MKRAVTTLLISTLALAAQVSAAESRLSWNTLEAGYGSIKLSGSGINLSSSSAWGVSASSLWTDHIYSQASYTAADFDLGITSRSNAITLGVRLPVSQTTDFFTEVSSDLSTVKAPGLKSSERSTAYGIGAKSLITENLEMTVSATRYDGDLGYAVSGLYMLSSSFGLRLNYSKSDADGASSKGTSLSAVLRF